MTGTKFWVSKAMLAGMLLGLAACGGGGSNSSTPAPPTPPAPPPTPPPPPPPSLDPEYKASANTPFVAGCEGAAIGGTRYANAEVEPHFAIDPSNPDRFFGAWQQDRWSSGGASGTIVGVSNDGGQTWVRSAPAFSRCAGGTPANGGDYERSSDPWVAVAPDGTAYAIVIAFNGAALASGSVTSVLVSRSTDSGQTWGAPTTLVREFNDVFHDKEAMTADPTDSRFVYAIWDRISVANFGPTWFARTVDGGQSWEAARPIFDPGQNNQTIGNLISVLPNGTLLNIYTRIDAAPNGGSTAYLDVIRSTDKGASWSTSTRIASQLTVGTVDPETGLRVRDGGLVPSAAVAPNGDVYVVWQDSRFSNGLRDGIAISRSEDGGLSWTAPARVNSDSAVSAFLPAITVREDGKVGVTYYDFRSNTSDNSTLLTSIWLTQSDDGLNWSENQVAGPFDLSEAPLAAWGPTTGYFLGDYQGLASSGSVFVPFYSRSGTGGNTNRTDIFAAPAVSASSSVSVALKHTAAVAAAVVVTPEYQHRIADNIEKIMKIRVPGKKEGSGRVD
ncbi:sialidase family protein [Dokdonella sp.]|uniref:sialidase family protein n=1 Tax=Dokdonella sp. TaxID=2291710 RepID=UPI003C5C3B4C